MALSDVLSRTPALEAIRAHSERNGPLPHLYRLDGQHVKALLPEDRPHRVCVWYIRLPAHRIEYCERLSQSRTVQSAPDGSPCHPWEHRTVCLAAPRHDRAFEPAAALVLPEMPLSDDIDYNTRIVVIYECAGVLFLGGVTSRLRYGYADFWDCSDPYSTRRELQERTRQFEAARAFAVDGEATTLYAPVFTFPDDVQLLPTNELQRKWTRAWPAAVGRLSYLLDKPLKGLRDDKRSWLYLTVSPTVFDNLLHTDVSTEVQRVTLTLDEKACPCYAISVRGGAHEVVAALMPERGEFDATLWEWAASGYCPVLVQNHQDGRTLTASVAWPHPREGAETASAMSCAKPEAADGVALKEAILQALDGDRARRAVHMGLVHDERQWRDHLMASHQDAAWDRRGYLPRTKRELEAALDFAGVQRRVAWTAGLVPQAVEILLNGLLPPATVIPLVGADLPALLPQALAEYSVWYVRLPLEQQAPTEAMLSQKVLEPYASEAENPWNWGLHWSIGELSGAASKQVEQVVLADRPGLFKGRQEDALVVVFECRRTLFVTVYARRHPSHQDVMDQQCDPYRYEYAFNPEPVEGILQRMRDYEDGKPEQPAQKARAKVLGLPPESPDEIAKRAEHSLCHSSWRSPAVGSLPSIVHWLPSHMRAAAGSWLRLTVSEEVFAQDGAVWSASASLRALTLRDSSKTEIACVEVRFQSASHTQYLAIPRSDERFASALRSWASTGTCQVWLENRINGRGFAIEMDWPADATPLLSGRPQADDTNFLRYIRNALEAAICTQQSWKRPPDDVVIHELVDGGG
jgi:hypothetical protein